MGSFMTGARGAADRLPRQREYVRSVLEQARAARDLVAPWRAVGGLEQHFSDEGGLLVALHREWLRLLLGRLHRGGVVAQRTPANVRDLHDEVAAENPTLRGLLDGHAAHPALWEPTAGEHAMLARLAGLATHGTPVEQAATLGRSLLRQRVPVQRTALGATRP